ncbi:GNAT family N-acetyltransferase [Streptomyces sp. P9-2B-2]|nr:GNAT family N-acetyltransferase [Streptomyces sp. P9-2B-2]WJY43072.1 GNAT family N-acetyltransferase [Streptomyces sp. P9-2B-2]
MCAGRHQPVGAVNEIVGVGTLPTARRRGLGLAVTAALVADARSRGVEPVFLSAGDEVGLIRFDGHQRSGVLPREDVHHGEHGEEEASASPFVHAGVQGRDRRAVPAR